MCVAALLALQTQWESDRRAREEEESRQRRKIENNPIPSLTACTQNEY